MYIDVKTLAARIGKSKRFVQLKIKDGSIRARQKNLKSYEVEVESLPAEWQALIPSAEAAPSSETAPAVKTDPSEVMLSPTAVKALGRPLTEKENKIYRIAHYYNNFPVPVQTEGEKVKMVASYFGVSESTVRRYVRQVEETGVITSPRKGSSSVWDPEAEAYMRAYYLQLIKDRNIDSKIAAYNAVCKQAEQTGWKVGCRASAYNILADIPKLYLSYAIGGNRALDNFFYIKRDLTNLKPAQILVGDQHICDFWVKELTEDGKERYYRPTFYVWEDMATRCIAGIAASENYDSSTVIEALYMAITRFGFFDCTYNDNGTSECSKATTMIIDELIALSQGKSQMMDISELYRLKDGSYCIEDEDGNVVDTAPDVKTWRAKNRRIYAAVKNAKTKPIERLFSTLEMKMAERGIPGHVVTPGCPADQEEKESAVLERQKRNGELLTLDQFVFQFIDVINEYEHTRHGSLKCSPLEAVQRHIEKGWRAKLPVNMKDLDFIFLSRKSVKVVKGRVTVEGVTFIGDDLDTDEAGNLLDKGLHMHDGEKVEIRYDELDMSTAYAVIPGSSCPIRALHRVEEINMLEEADMQRMIKWKRHSMKLVREAFKRVAYPASEKAIETTITKELEEAQKPLKALEAKEEKAKKKRLLEEEKKEKKKKILNFFATPRDRFKWCLNQLIDGDELDANDLAFVRQYRETEEYQEEKEYWTTFERFGGIV